MNQTMAEEVAEEAVDHEEVPKDRSHTTQTHITKDIHHTNRLKNKNMRHHQNLRGAEDFSSWMNHLKLALFMYDIDCDGDFTYWDLVEGYLENWDPYFPIKLHLREKAYLRAQAFVILTIERNCDDDAHRLIRNCTTAASKFQRLRENYENKLIADLGIVVSDVVKLTYQEEEGDIRSHIRTFDERWEKMTMTAGGNLRPEHQEFGEIIERVKWQRRNTSS